MGRTKISKPKTVISPVKQVMLLKSKYETLKFTFNPNKLVWKGLIQPTSLSEKYTIHITYKMHSVPRVFVRNLELQERKGKLPPHLYKEGNLCLYYPKNNEWDEQKYIAKTIIPWTSLWLYCYEIWLTTGEWCGGGIHPPEK